jgi:hypothetical protein
LLLASRQSASLLDPRVAAVARPVLEDAIAAGDAAATLRRYSRISPAGDGLVLVHRLVQAMTRTQLRAEERFDAGDPIHDFLRR